MKICVDCVHHVKQRVYIGMFGYTQNACAMCAMKIKEQEKTCPVTGEVTPPVYGSCQAMRFDDGDCGPDAKLFEPKPTKHWWEFWK